MIGLTNGCDDPFIAAVFLPLTLQRRIDHSVLRESSLPQ